MSGSDSLLKAKVNGSRGRYVGFSELLELNLTAIRYLVQTVKN